MFEDAIASRIQKIEQFAPPDYRRLLERYLASELAHSR
jgi:hypothetical protein